MTITSLSLPSGGMGCKAVPKLSGVRTLCWILLDTDDFNQQQNIFCNAMVRQRQAGCHTGVGDVQPVNFHRPTNSAAAIHSWHHYEKLWTFSYQMSPWPWLCPDGDRQAVSKSWDWLPATQHRAPSVVSLSHGYIGSLRKSQHIWRDQLSMMHTETIIKNTNTLRITTS